MSWSDFLVVLPCMKDSHRANNWLDGDTTLLFFLTPAGSHQLNGNARVQLLPPLPRKSNGRLGLLSPNLSGVPCNFSFLTSRYKYRGFDQRFIRIQLLYTYLHSLTVKCFDSNAQHQPVTRPAPLSGLHPLSGQSDARGLEIPSSLQLLWLVTHNALPKVRAGH